MVELIFNTRHYLLDQMTDAARCIVSEPLSELADSWQPNLFLLIYPLFFIPGFIRQKQ